MPLQYTEFLEHTANIFGMAKERATRIVKIEYFVARIFTQILAEQIHFFKVDLL